MAKVHMSGGDQSAQAKSGWPVASTPPCAICGDTKRGLRTQRHLTHGISVWLCDSHGGDAFICRRGGMDFAERLAGVWAASGITSQRWGDALSAHVRRVRSAGAHRAQPGSYSWPVLREEAERRFAAGEDPHAVITELRQNNADGPALAPSVRTMRRWFTQARWLDAPRPEQRRRSLPTIPSKFLRPGVGLMPRGMTQNPVFPFVHPWKDDP